MNSKYNLLGQEFAIWKEKEKRCISFRLLCLMLCIRRERESTRDRKREKFYRKFIHIYCNYSFYSSVKSDFPTFRSFVAQSQIPLRNMQFKHKTNIYSPKSGFHRDKNFIFPVAVVLYFPNAYSEQIAFYNWKLYRFRPSSYIFHFS